MNRKLLLFAFALSSTLSSIASDFISGGIRYEIESYSSDNEVYVIPLGGTDYPFDPSITAKYSGVVTIPDSVNYNGVDYEVVGISAYSFYGCGVTSVTIEEGLYYINEYAFASCPMLTSVTIPNSVRFIASDAFSNTAWYDSQPDGLVYLGKAAYKYKGTMPENSSIVIKDGTVSISECAFSKCENLVSIECPSSLISVGAYAFSGCKNLSAISVNDSLTSIGIDAFDDTAWYDSQSDGVIYLGSMFYGYKGGVLFVDTLTVKDGTKTINRQSFTRQSIIKALVIPEGVYIIGVEAFYHCDNLESVTLPSSLNYIAPSAFAECNKIKEVTISALTPPSLISSVDLFSSTAYANAVLYVPAESVNAYKAADGWSSFSKIQAIGTTDVALIGSDNTAVEYYDLSGKMIDAPQSGFNIIKYSNGQIKKVFIEE